MKNKIKQFAKGDFKVEQPEIRFSDKQIVMSVSEGEVYEGSFFIESVKGGNIRGLVYPSSFRVHCLEEGFDANPVEVKFTYDSTGLLPGQIDNGKTKYNPYQPLSEGQDMTDQNYVFSNNNSGLGAYLGYELPCRLQFNANYLVGISDLLLLEQNPKTFVCTQKVTLGIAYRFK